MADPVQVFDGDGVPPGDKPLIVKVREQVGFSLNDIVDVQPMTAPVPRGMFIPFSWTDLDKGAVFSPNLPLVVHTP